MLRTTPAFQCCGHTVGHRHIYTTAGGGVKFQQAFTSIAEVIAEILHDVPATVCFHSAYGKQNKHAAGVTVVTIYTCDGRRCPGHAHQHWEVCTQLQLK